MDFLKKTLTLDGIDIAIHTSRPVYRQNDEIPAPGSPSARRGRIHFALWLTPHAGSAGVPPAFLPKQGQARTWGGLRRVLTPAGDFLWVCPEHYREYDPGLPDLSSS